MYGPVTKDQEKLEQLYKDGIKSHSRLPIFTGHEYVLIADKETKQIILVDRSTLDDGLDTHGYSYSALFCTAAELKESVEKLVAEHKTDLLRTMRVSDFALGKNPVMMEHTNVSKPGDIYARDTAINKSLRVLKSKAGIVIGNPLVNDAEDILCNIRDYFNEVTKPVDMTKLMIEGRSERPSEKPLDAAQIVKAKDAGPLLAQDVAAKSVLFVHYKN